VIEVTMPKLGPSMEDGTVVKWHKAEGDPIRKGEPLFEIETDKSVVEVEAEAAGVLRKVLAGEGEKRAVGNVIGLIGEADEPLPQARAQGLPRPVADPARAPRAHAAEPRPSEADQSKLKASPAARRLASELDVDLSVVAGTGPEGRITSEDVERAAGAARGGSAELAGTIVTPNTMRRAIAERMSVSKQTVPHFYVSADADMTSVLAARREWKAREGDRAPSINDVLIWACARALKEHSALNSAWQDGRIVIYDAINVGFAMAVGNGLVAPVVRSADALSVAEIGERTGALARKAADKKLTPGDTDGATFTLSNLGMFEVEWFVPIISPPQCAVLAAGRVTERVVPRSGEVAIRPMATLTLAADHRIIDGVAAGRFLQAVKGLLEAYPSRGGVT
jgi:pyruvate dehydrogenase E2 component (dihydrolipoamide acetyltransferase)